MGRRVDLAAARTRLAGALLELKVAAVEAPYEEVLWDVPDDEVPGLKRSLRMVLPMGADPRAAAARLAREPGVESAEPDAVYHLVGAGFFPNDSFFQDGSQWGLWNTGAGPFGGVAGVDIRAPLGWAISIGSTATILGIVDTGFDLHHPELNGTLADGTPRVIRTFNSSIEGPSGAPDDSVGHGTIVAGVAFARTNNGPVLDGRSLAGVCGGSGGDSAGCRIVEVKATPTRLTDALASELAKGIAYAAVAGARAINLSFGGEDDNSDVRDAMSFAQRRGAVVICGAGNGQDERPQYPGYYARYGDGVSVAAIKSDGSLARFSSRGPQIDVAAPGEDIQSTYLTYPNAYGSPFRNWVSSAGTSFAAPFVTGLAGLAYTVQPDIIDNEFQAVLRSTARDVGAPGRDDTYGWGIPDAPALLTALLPPRRFERGIVAAQSWTLLGTDSVTLSKTRMVANGCSIDGHYMAERWEVRAHVSVPAGKLLETPQVIVRVHGTNGLGGWPNAQLLEYDGLDFGEAIPGTVTPTGFELRTYVYRVFGSPPNCTILAPIDFVPQEPKDIRFAWSALAKRDDQPIVRIDLPTEGQSVPVGPVPIRWTATDPDTITATQIALSIDGGATYVTLANLQGNPGRATIQIPCSQAGRSYRLRVRAVDQHDFHDQGEASIAFTPAQACVEGENPQLPPVFALLPPTPNPSSGTTAFNFYLPDAGSTRSLRLYDLHGRILRTISIADALSGPGGVVWDGLDDRGVRAPAGLYVARLVTSSGIATRRFVRI
jgi:hypothetical protein